MKGFIAGSVAVLASVASASPAPSKVEARADSSSSGSLPAVTVKGNAFFAGDKRFYIRGIDYQPGGSSGDAGGTGASDPIADEETCLRDIAEFKKLGVNTVRIYTVDNSKNHDKCMQHLADAGIYLALDVNSPNYSINRAKPAISYNEVYLQSVFATMDAFSKYSNTLLFFSGNEIINDDKTVQCAPFIKAVTRDMKEYRDSRGMRKIPIGYSAADVSETRYQLADYLNCGTEDQRSDFFAFNDYAWCSPSTYEQAWKKNVDHFSNYSIPLFLSEYGCTKTTRTFEEVEALYSDKMTKVYSGGLVYEYSKEGETKIAQSYGIVDLSGDSPKELDGFTKLQSELQKTPIPTGDGGYTTSNQPSTCPADDEHWSLTGFSGAELPAMPKKAADYMKNGAGTAPGLVGGSQDSGTEDVATASPGSGSATAYTTQPGATGGSGSGSSSGSSSSSTTSPSSAAVTMSTPAVNFGFVAAFGAVIVSTFLGATML